MTETLVRTAKDYKSDVRPVWCPGCGNYGTLTAVTQAFAELQLDPSQIMFSSGIGCASRFPYFVQGYCLHGVHGRAVPVGTGMSVARPDLTVLVVGGDGDGLSIGGGHIIHAARKNIDLTYMISNNSVYGLTKGQTSPTTWIGQKTTTSPVGAVDPPLNPILQFLAADASFVARAYTGRPGELKAIIVEAIRHPGFAILEVLSPCPSFNRTMSFKTLNEQVISLPEDHDPTDRRAAIDRAMETDKNYVGIFYRQVRPTYSAMCEQLRQRSRPVADRKAGLRDLMSLFG